MDQWNDINVSREITNDRQKIVESSIGVFQAYFVGLSYIHMYKGHRRFGPEIRVFLKFAIHICFLCMGHNGVYYDV